MTDHTCKTLDPNCYRCQLNEDEMKSDTNELDALRARVERRYQGLDELIRSQLSEVAGPQPGVMFVLHHLRRLDAYTSVGAGIDMRDRESLNQLRWVEVHRTADGWSCNPLNEEERKPFLDYRDA